MHHLKSFLSFLRTLISVVSIVLVIAATLAYGLFLNDGEEIPLIAHPSSTPTPTPRTDSIFRLSISTPRTTTKTKATTKPKATVKPKATTIATQSKADYYKLHYPMTWGYISKNADYPSSYVITYDRIWGDLQRYRGDGIPFDTLTLYEMSLVNYPAIGSKVYFSSTTSRTYHSTLDCYTLLKSSSPVYRSSSTRYQYEPCSKCVGE